MKFNTASTKELSEAYLMLTNLANDKKMVEVKEIQPRRSLNQNAYYWLLVEYFGSHFGYTKSETNAIVKQLNKDIFVYTKINRGKAFNFTKSTADLTKEDMTKVIDSFRAWSLKAGLELPLATDQEALRRAENYAETNRRYL